MLHRTIRDKWVKALTSGKFEQAKGRLKNNGGYCCLGVLCEITGNAHNRAMSSIYPKINDMDEPLPFMGLDKETQERLSTMNDDEEKNFNEIAEYIMKLPVRG